MFRYIRPDALTVTSFSNFTTGTTCSVFAHMAAREKGWRFIFSWKPQEIDSDFIHSEAPHSKRCLNPNILFKEHDIRMKSWQNRHKNKQRMGGWDMQKQVIQEEFIALFFSFHCCLQNLTFWSSYWHRSYLLWEVNMFEKCLSQV